MPNRQVGFIRITRKPQTALTAGRCSSSESFSSFEGPTSPQQRPPPHKLQNHNQLSFGRDNQQNPQQLCNQRVLDQCSAQKSGWAEAQKKERVLVRLKRLEEMQECVDAATSKVALSTRRSQDWEECQVYNQTQSKNLTLLPREVYPHQQLSISKIQEDNENDTALRGAPRPYDAPFPQPPHSADQSLIVEASTLIST